LIWIKPPSVPSTGPAIAGPMQDDAIVDDEQDQVASTSFFAREGGVQLSFGCADAAAVVKFGRLLAAIERGHGGHT
jgi:hypothetical protein